MFAGVDAGDDGVEDAGGPIDDVERRVEALFGGFAGGDGGGIFVGDPAGVDGVHVDAIGIVVGGGGAGHHIQRGFGHVGMGMAGGFADAVELAFDGGNVDDVFVALGGSEHEWFEAGVEDEWGDGVDQMHLKEFDGRDFRHEETPGVAATEVDLLEILIEAAGGEEMILGGEFFRQQRNLGEFGAGASDDGGLTLIGA